MKGNVLRAKATIPAEGRTFLRTLGAQRTSVRACVRQNVAFFKMALV